jgi:hypothetical protein
VGKLGINHKKSSKNPSTRKQDATIERKSEDLFIERKSGSGLA